MTAPISTKLLAPQARLVDLATGTVVGATQLAGAAGARPTAVIAPDIIAASVTLTNTGIGQLSVTLNNQRFDHTLGVGRPVFPPWKYNDFSQARARLASTGIGGIRFGQKLRLDMRYGDGTWTKMIIVQVTSLEFSFAATTGAQVVVKGEDLLGLLKVKPNSKPRPYDRKHEEQIVTEVWNQVITAADQRPTPRFVDGARVREGRTQPLRSHRHDKSQTYYQFVEAMAQRLDYEIFVEFKNSSAARDASVGQATSGAITVASELDFHFVPARSGNPPVAAEQDGLDQAEGTFHHVLRWGRSLIDFKPKFKVFEMPTSAEALGTNHGRRSRSTQRLTQGEIDQMFRAELPVSPNYRNLQMKTALQARTDYFGAAGVSGENNESTRGTNLDSARLKRKAMAAFLKKVREFLTAEVKTIGLPKLRPGTYLDIVGLRPPFDGYYYVTKTVHTLDAKGYVTQLSVRRPGMLPPEKYLDLPVGAQPPPAATPPESGATP